MYGQPLFLNYSSSLAQLHANASGLISAVLVVSSTRYLGVRNTHSIELNDYVQTTHEVSNFAH